MAAEIHGPDDTAAQGGRSPWPLFGFALAGVVIVLDQITKWVILGPLAFSPPECRALGVGCGRIEVSSVFDLTMVWNRGVSFGMFQAESGVGRWMLVIFAAAVAGLLSAWLLRARRPFAAVALGCVIGGAIGNLIDRARFGAVVDFLDFSGPWFGVMIGERALGFPWVFNVADAAINVGAVFLVLEIVLERRAGAAYDARAAGGSTDRG
jgi:signal peptidase II